jgi:hypothetical protein
MLDLDLEVLQCLVVRLLVPLLQALHQLALD